MSAVAASAPPALGASPTVAARRAVVGTAGHVDHGKTTLVSKLSGIDTDRLKEEQERGISIELGFAHLSLPSGRVVSIVDVPGHEKFVRTMVAGAGGIDLALLVIAADEGVKPQTREHLDILRLLGVAHGVVALTKSDLVDAEWLELQTMEVRELLSRTPLAAAPIVPVSAATKAGFPELLAALDAELDRIAERDATGLVRIPVDRCFAMKGFGTVVTGTLASGRIREGDELEVLPKGLRVRVRGVQVHGRAVGEALAGQRTALNLTGAERDEVAKGDLLATLGYLRSSFLLDVRLRLLPGAAPLKNRRRLALHLGTREIACRVVLLEADSVAPGSEALAQLYVEEPVAAMRGERFILRSWSPPGTVGGGTVLDPSPTKHRRRDAKVLEGLTASESGDPALLAEAVLAAPGRVATDAAALARAIGVPEQELGPVLDRVRGLERIENRWLVLAATLDSLRGEVAAACADFHKSSPLKAGVPKEELRLRLCPTWDALLFHAILTRFAASGLVVVAGDVVRLPGHAVSLDDAQQSRSDALERAFRNAGLSTPPIGDVVKTPDDRKLFDHLVRIGALVKASGDIVFHRAALDEAKQKISAHVKSRGGLTIGDAKELLGTTRKYLVPLLELFDATGFTLRAGDKRVLRKPT